MSIEPATKGVAADYAHQGVDQSHVEVVFKGNVHSKNREYQEVDAVVDPEADADVGESLDQAT